jgi:hypothetical protein
LIFEILLLKVGKLKKSNQRVRKGGDEKEIRTLKELFSTEKEGDYEGI